VDGASAALLGDELRANATLEALTLRGVDLWRHAPADVAAPLLRALAGHARLGALSVSDNPVEGAARRGAAGAALAALLAANAPALTELDVSWCDLGDAGLRPLFLALRANTHLRALNCSLNGLTEACARTRLLPAVRANTSLRQLSAQLPGLTALHSAREAEALVQRRADADAANEQ
jgi:hypothetical protein